MLQKLVVSMIAEHKNNGLSLYPVLTFLIGSENGGLFYSYRLMSLMDIAWTEVMHKDGQTFCLGLVISLLHKIGSCSILYFLCCYAIT